MSAQELQTIAYWRLTLGQCLDYRRRVEAEKNLREAINVLREKERGRQLRQPLGVASK